jgi:hypothetical protein
MSSIRINGRSYEQVCGKYLVDVETNEYLQYNGTEFVHSAYTPAPAGSIDLLLFRDGKVVKFEDPSVVLGGGEQEEEDDVPVNRAAALIEEALNAKAAGCGCDCGCGADCTGCDCDCGCPKTAPVVEEVPAVVEEAPVVVEEAPVVVEEEVPELVEADAT